MIYLEDTETGRIKFTSHGIEQFKERFAGIGIDIQQLKDKTDFELAYETYLNTQMFLKGMKNEDPDVDVLLKDIPAFAVGKALREGLGNKSAEAESEV